MQLGDALVIIEYWLQLNCASNHFSPGIKKSLLIKTTADSSFEVQLVVMLYMVFAKGANKRGI